MLTTFLDDARIAFFAVPAKPRPAATVAPATVSVTLPLAAAAPFEPPPRDVAALESVGAITPPHHSRHHHHHPRAIPRRALTELVSATDWVDPFSND